KKNAAQLVVGSRLQIKRVLTCEDKRSVPYEKIRTRKKALNKIMTLFDEAAKGGDLINATLIYSTNKEEAENLKAELEEKYTNVNIILSYFGPVIATHLGEG
ncbi:DegV family protein, partial [Micrococcus sp. SIMBA_144]